MNGSKNASYKYYIFKLHFFQGFECKCSLGFTGAQCQFDVNECLSSPCQHGGSCAEDGINSFKCYCPTGYNGTTCQHRKEDSDLATTSIFNDLTSTIDTGTSTTISISTTSNDFSSTTTGSAQSL